MAVFEFMQMLWRHEKVTILTELVKNQIARRASAYEYEEYTDEFPREVFEAILEKTAKSVDLEEMIIYCEELAK
jgi:hypothetical protein